MKKSLTIELKPEQIHDDLLIRKIISKSCNINENEITGIDYLKRSLDARSKNPKYLLNLEVFINEHLPVRNLIKSNYKNTTGGKRVLIVGAGPAGYFAALELLEFGIKPIIFDRGKNIRDRRPDLRQIMQTGVVNPNSNYCFGEGGAGAYSDGKLYTRSDKRGNTKKILQILVEHGADPDILVDAHPHIGSNKLPQIISAIRDTILEFGGEVYFNSQVTDLILSKEKCEGVIVNQSDEYLGDAVILATGHSARDIYYLFQRKNIFIESKPFAVGFRVEHYQEHINIIQYGKGYSSELPSASYKLVAQVNGAGVFSFCMCPGGIVMPSATASYELVVNGMSMSKRNSRFANSGIVTSVDEKDFSEFSKFGALAGLKFQEELESRFYAPDSENLLKAPAQRLIDFLEKKKSNSLNESSYIPGLVNSELSGLFPKNISDNLKSGFQTFGQKMRGFLTNEANAIGLESRTSSPVRITRNRETYSHVEITNLYPCGEGSGYAGGIVSSAVDGQNSARALANHFRK